MVTYFLALCQLSRVAPFVMERHHNVDHLGLLKFHFWAIFSNPQPTPTKLVAIVPSCKILIITVKIHHNVHFLKVVAKVWGHPLTKYGSPLQS